MDKIKGIMRQKIKAFIPSAFNRALCSYRTFTSKSVDNDTKEFSAYHSACKNALSHIDNLIKLSNFTEEKDNLNTQNDKQENNNLEIILNKAKQELKNIDNE